LRCMSDSSSKKQDPPVIDLGLTALLSGVESSKASCNGPLVTSEAQDEPLMNKLLAERRWTEIIARSEQDESLRNSGEGALWWIQGHLGELSMPVSLLIAPFEEAAKRCMSAPASPALQELLENTGQSILLRLRQLGDAEQAAAFGRMLRDRGIRCAADPSEREPFKLGAIHPPALEARGLATPARGTGSRPIRSTIRLSFAMLLLLCAGIALLRLPLSATPTALASESFIRDSAPKEQRYPEVVLPDAVGNLGALYYSFEETRPDPQSSTGSTPPGAPQEGTGATAPPQPAPERTLAPKLPQRERINTAGPVEDQAFRDGVAGRKPLPAKPGGRPNPTAQRGPFGDGPPPATPFDRPVDGRLYRVIAPAKVVSAPSYTAQVLGRLEPGDKVMVDGRIGTWMRLRSRRGRDGYVLAQDVVPADRAADTP